MIHVFHAEAQEQCCISGKDEQADVKALGSILEPMSVDTDPGGFCL